MTFSSSQPEVPELTLQSLGEKPPPADILPKLRPAKEVLLGVCVRRSLLGVKGN
jgi:hypothetical protein